MGGFVAWTGRIAVFGYMTFYTALDVLAGIGTGELLMRFPGSPPTEQIDALYAVGRNLKFIGVGWFLLAVLATSSLLIRRVGRGAIPGAVVLVTSTIVFFDSHIYWPEGVFTMIGLALGFGLLAAASRPDPVPA